MQLSSPHKAASARLSNTHWLLTNTLYPGHSPDSFCGYVEYRASESCRQQRQSSAWVWSHELQPSVVPSVACCSLCRSVLEFSWRTLGPYRGVSPRYEHLCVDCQFGATCYNAVTLKKKYQTQHQCGTRFLSVIGHHPFHKLDTIKLIQY